MGETKRAKQINWNEADGRRRTSEHRGDCSVFCYFSSLPRLITFRSPFSHPISDFFPSPPHVHVICVPFARAFNSRVRYFDHFCFTFHFSCSCRQSDVKTLNGRRSIRAVNRLACAPMFSAFHVHVARLILHWRDRCSRCPKNGRQKVNTE